MRSSVTIRIRIITTAVLLLALLILVRLYMVQVQDHEVYAARADNQYVHTVQELFNRGSIYFTTKEGEQVSAATVRSGFVLSINPSVIADPEFVYDSLSSVVDGIDRESFLAHARNTEDRHHEVMRRVPQETAERIESLELAGVQLHRDQWRYYPGDALQARAIGFVAYDENELLGRYGLEKYYDNILIRDDERLSVNFFAELFGNLGSMVFDRKESRRGDVVTSIEPTVARTLQSELSNINEDWGSKETGGIILNPQTGDVFALSSVPAFNLNDRTGADIGDFKNPLVGNVYEFGSIIKPLTMAAGIDSGAVSPQSTYHDAGSVELDGATIRNFDGRARGTVPMQEVLSQSLNTGAAHIVQEMGTERFSEYFLDLDLGTETGIDLPNEIHGLISNLQSPRKVEYATASFGQGIALTPIGAARALATLGNGGTLVTPHLAQEVHFEDGSMREVSFPPDEQVFSEDTSEAVTRMLVEVVDKALARGEYKKEHYTIAAKTGTAQIARADGRGYYDDRFLHSFFGYFPAYDPQFLIFLYTIEPNDVRYASETLTEPFMDLSTFLLNYYNVPPDR